MKGGRKKTISIEQKPSEMENFMKKFIVGHLVPILTIISFMTSILSMLQYCTVTNSYLFCFFYVSTLFAMGMLSQIFPDYFKVFNKFTFGYINIPLKGKTVKK